MKYVLALFLAYFWWKLKFSIVDGKSLWSYLVFDGAMVFNA
jgi:hypothetical protein